MTLLKCPECGVSVSSYAQNCMECGCPIQSILDGLNNENKMN